MLGSGLGGLVDAMQVTDRIPYRHIPDFPVSTVAGHAGEMLFGSLNGVEVCVLNGRKHFYEGVPMDEVTFPVRVLKELGGQVLILSNAAGGLNPSFQVGDVMLMTDHIAQFGVKPLGTTTVDSKLSPVQVYSRRLLWQTLNSAKKLQIPLQHGVYLAHSGPYYGTRAESKMQHLLGADAVGMSTIPEAVVARSLGMEVLAFSVITDMAAECVEDHPTHKAVLRAAKTAGEKLVRLVAEVIRPTFAIHTLGCKLNFAESSDIARQLTENGFIQAEHPQYIILNSCAVTAVAEKKARNLVAHLHRETPEAQIVVVGCYAALRPKEILQWPGVVATFGNEDKMNVIPFLKGEPLPEKPVFYSAFSSNDRTRSFLKIQDGCDYHCTYCTVWKARGDSRSDTVENVVAQIHRIEHQEMKEVNLTGVNLGDFGRRNGRGFYELLQAIERENFNLRFRISSIEPNLLTDEIIALAAESKVIMPHFHIPLQSANNRVLGEMHRRYQRELYAEKVLKIKELMPHACIAMDIIAGFPGETDVEFADGLAFLEQLPISYCHVFTYSRRPGTIAAALPQQVDPSVKHERTNQLIELSNRKKIAFYGQHIGENRSVLWEAENKNGLMSGFTDNYIKLQRPFAKEKVNTIEQVLIQKDMLVL